MVNYPGTGPWQTYPPGAAPEWQAFEDLTTAVDNVLAHRLAVMLHRSVPGAVHSYLGHPLT